MSLYEMLKMRKRTLTGVFCLVLFFCCAAGTVAGLKMDSDPRIRLVTPDPRGGVAYKLVYSVNVPLDTYWRFKTDFSGSFLSTNEYIKQHRLVRSEDHSVITENKYTIGPDATYRWRTKIFDKQHRLEYWLLNPGECGQEFHYGYIQAEADGVNTKVTQVAYLDFFGVSLWAHFPFEGGMKEFLRSTARWEQQTALRLEWKYETKRN